MIDQVTSNVWFGCGPTTDFGRPKVPRLGMTLIGWIIIKSSFQTTCTKKLANSQVFGKPRSATCHLFLHLSPKLSFPVPVFSSILMMMRVLVLVAILNSLISWIYLLFSWSKNKMLVLTSLLSQSIWLSQPLEAKTEFFSSWFVI